MPDTTYSKFQVKVAISNHRIQHINYQNKTVTFQAKNYKNDGQKQLLTLTSQEFIRRFGLHILPKGFTRIRHYGILSSSWKKEKLPALQALLCANKSPILKHQKTTEMVHRKCPSCKKGVLQTDYFSIKEDHQKNG